MTTEKEAKPSIRFVEPYETLRPCRSRIIAGGIMILVAFGLIYFLSG